MSLRCHQTPNLHPARTEGLQRCPTTAHHAFNGRGRGRPPHRKDRHPPKFGLQTTQSYSDLWTQWTTGFGKSKATISTRCVLSYFLWGRVTIPTVVCSRLLGKGGTTDYATPTYLSSINLTKLLGRLLRSFNSSYVRAPM